ncbi:MAG: Hsp20/alpha crystallin family protein [Thermoanaerobaculia bacterium]|nr:Hsp20/alpha crystallin family protein [Thermoanaerobaculia bacterium]
MSNIAKFRPFPTTNFLPDSLLDNFFNRSIGDFLGSDVVVNRPAVNILETANGFELEFAAPGFEKKDFSLNVEEGYLTVSATKENKQEESNERFTRREFRFDSFKRTFKIPETVNQDSIKAVYENGVLQVTLPKKEEATTIVKTIEIG